MSTKTKAVLVNELNDLTTRMAEFTKKADDYDLLLSKYDILKMARVEDKTAVENAKTMAEEYKNKETVLVRTFHMQTSQLQTSLNEQNQTIETLFEMMDNAISQQIFYYNKFKGIFLSMKEPEKQEPPKQ